MSRTIKVGFAPLMELLPSLLPMASSMLPNLTSMIPGMSSGGMTTNSPISSQRKSSLEAKRAELAKRKALLEAKKIAIRSMPQKASQSMFPDINPRPELSKPSIWDEIMKETPKPKEEEKKDNTLLYVLGAGALVTVYILTKDKK
jgi:hypothetical protein